VIELVDVRRDKGAPSVPAAQRFVHKVLNGQAPSRAPGVNVSFSSSMLRATLLLLYTG
jgi:hypothetical protein